MFTGIVSNIGKVVHKSPAGWRIAITFRFQKPEKRKPNLGESIAVNGVCLTVRKTNGRSFQADVVRETLEATNLGSLQIGDFVNLERSLKYGDEIGGHFVTGHVDACGKILKKTRSGMIVKAPAKLMPCIAPKGSITVDGISLTVQKVQKVPGPSKGPGTFCFTVAIIPHTLKNTTLALKKKGAVVNLEIDLVARYLKKLGF